MDPAATTSHSSRMASFSLVINGYTAKTMSTPVRRKVVCYRGAGRFRCPFPLNTYSMLAPAGLGEAAIMASALCLACSSSLPPRSHAHEVFTTPCCGRPICPNCLKSNPRLARYDPCLACLGGVDAVASNRSQRPNNITGAVRDEDTYVIGDDDEDPDSDPDNDGHRRTPPPVYQAQAPEDDPDPVQATFAGNDSLYHIKHGDTLHGIAFKLGVDVSSSDK